MAPKVAFVTGANGITGSAIIEYLHKNTTTEQWTKVIATSRSPLQTQSSFSSDPRLSFVALDFSKPVSTLVKEMAGPCADVTHAYFSSYVHKDDFKELNEANSQLFETFLTALVQTAPKLENVTLQTGQLSRKKD
jgi:nucleoside-diphosphate-sugar epimerase